ncbi:unnamed protein product [Cuscuta campestris]|uniref:Uncharacterized protein n=1 Tax=Cuscuta campestris TaxID=132261 RepID=A0A484NHZ6_9ASTE|nr:unnamed protein product [Cuscuta campestris]
MSLDDLESSVLAHEKKLISQDNESEQALKASVNHHSSSGNRGGRGRGRGRGRGSNYQSQNQPNQFQGRGGERGGHHSTNHKSRSVDKSKVECFRCHNITEPAQKNKWYLDSGCSNHMCGDKNVFTTLDESFRNTVKFGDNSTVSVMGKGTVSHQAKDNSTHIISDVLFVPDLKPNLLSIGQLQEKGYEVSIKDGVCRIRDAKLGLIAQGIVYHAGPSIGGLEKEMNPPSHVTVDEVQSHISWELNENFEFVGPVETEFRANTSLMNEALGQRTQHTASTCVETEEAEVEGREQLLACEDIQEGEEDLYDSEYLVEDGDDDFNFEVSENNLNDEVNKIRDEEQLEVDREGEEEFVRGTYEGLGEHFRVEVGSDVSDYAASDEELETDFEDDDKSRPKFPSFHERFILNPQFELGLLFKDKKQFKKACQNWGIKHRWEVRFKKDNKVKVVCICPVEGCNFRITAAKVDKKDNQNNTFQVTMMKLDHTCGEKSLKMCCGMLLGHHMKLS